MPTSSNAEEKKEELLRTYERFAREIKQLTEKQNELLAELLSLYTEIKMDKAKNNSTE